MKQKYQTLAAEIRIEQQKPQGVIVLFRSRYAGWMNTLRDPAHWIPGCVAVEPDGACHIATGGTDEQGAKRWEVMA